MSITNRHVHTTRVHIIAVNASLKVEKVAVGARQGISMQMFQTATAMTLEITLTAETLAVIAVGEIINNLYNKEKSMNTQVVTLPRATTIPITVNGNERTDFQAIVNEDDHDHIYCIPTDTYQLVQHEDTLDMIEGALVKSPFGKDWKSKTWLMNEGARLRKTYTFENHPYEIGRYGGRKDIIYPTVYVYNSYDRWCRFALDFGIMRVICVNGAKVGERFARFAMKHTTNLDVEQSIKILVSGFDIYKEQVEIWKKWQKTIMDFKDFTNITTALKFSTKALEELGSVKETGTGITLGDVEKGKVNRWLAFCLLTQFITHNVKSQLQRISYEQNLRRLMQ
jgi:hypothetical protein